MCVCVHANAINLEAIYTIFPKCVHTENNNLFILVFINAEISQCSEVRVSHHEEHISILNVHCSV